MAVASRRISADTGRQKSPIDKDRLAADRQNGRRAENVEPRPKGRANLAVTQSGLQSGKPRREFLDDRLARDLVNRFEFGHGPVMGAVPGYRRAGPRHAARQDGFGKEGRRIAAGQTLQPADQIMIAFNGRGTTNQCRLVPGNIRAANEMAIFTHECTR